MNEIFLIIFTILITSDVTNFIHDGYPIYYLS